MILVKQKIARSIIIAAKLRYFQVRIELEISAFLAATPPEQTNWCYHCATPLSRVHPNLRRAIEMLLSLRRTAYPSDVVTAECTEPKNLSRLATEQCRHPHCQTLILTDHDAGIVDCFILLLLIWYSDKVLLFNEESSGCDVMSCRRIRSLHI